MSIESWHDDRIGLDCPMRAYNALHRRGITTYRQLAQVTEWDLRSWRGFGEKTRAEIRAHLASRGLTDVQLMPTLFLAQLADLNDYARHRLPA